LVTAIVLALTWIDNLLTALAIVFCVVGFDSC